MNNLNRTTSLLILILVTAVAGGVLVFNFYQANLEDKKFDWVSYSFESRQSLEEIKK
jgi:hypothetical protein